MERNKPEEDAEEEEYPEPGTYFEPDNQTLEKHDYSEWAEPDGEAWSNDPADHEPES